MIAPATGEVGSAPTMPDMIDAVHVPSVSSDVTPWIDALPDVFKDGSEPNTHLVSRLSQEINEAISHAKSDRAPILTRISRNEKLVKNRPNAAVSKLPYKKAKAYHVPLTGPKLDSRFNSLVQTLTDPDKFYTLQRLGASEETKEVSEDLQWHLDNAGWDDAIQDLAELAKYCDPILMIDFMTDERGNEASNVIGPYAGLKFEVIHPEFFLVHPTNHPSILHAAFAGHEFDQRVGDIKAKQAQKIYMPGNVIGGIESNRTKRLDPGMQTDSGSSIDDHQNVNMYDALVRFRAEPGKDEVVYRVIGDATNGIVYRIEEYDCPYSKYITFRLKKDLNAYWSEDSPANDSQAVQLLWNMVINTIYWGFEYATRPSVITGGGNQDSLQDIPPGTKISVVSLANAIPLQTAMQMAGMQGYLETLVDISDLTTKTPNTVTGSNPQEGQTTATADNIKIQGFQATGQADVKHWLPYLIQACKLALWTIAQNFDAVHQTYADYGVLKIQDVNELKTPMQIFVSGQKPKATPQVQMQELMQILQLAAIAPEIQQLGFELAIRFIGQTSIDGKEEIIAELEKIKLQEEQMNQLVQAMNKAGMDPTQHPVTAAHMERQAALPQQQAGAQEGSRQKLLAS